MGLPVSTPSRSPDALLTWVLGSAFAGYFVVRGWLSACLALTCLVSLVQFSTGQVRLPSFLADRRLCWLAVAFASPLLAVGVVQLLHQQFIPKYFDAPLRPLTAAVVTAYLVQRRLDLVRPLGILMPIAVLLCAALLFLEPNARVFYWGNRLASYFMDPLTLAQHITIAGFICLFAVDVGGPDPGWLRVLKYTGFAAAIAISIATQSRTGWVMIPLLAAVWLIGVKRNNGAVRMPVALLVITLACAAAYWASDLVHERVTRALQEFCDYFSGGDRDTSIGVRLSIFRASWILFVEHPLFGWGFDGLPALSSIPGIAAFWTPMADQYFVLSGGHNELIQSMTRMGLIGLASRLLLFLVPLALFVAAARSPQPRRRSAGYLGLTVVIGYMTASLSSEVFNLIYAASFYALLVAVLAASSLIGERP